MPRKRHLLLQAALATKENKTKTRKRKEKKTKKKLSILLVILVSNTCTLTRVLFYIPSVYKKRSSTGTFPSGT